MKTDENLCFQIKMCLYRLGFNCTSVLYLSYNTSMLYLCVICVFFSFFFEDALASLNFTKEPANPTYFVVNEQIQLVWEYDSQLGTPDRINFAKYDDPSRVYDSLADKFPAQTFVYIHSSRLDVVGLATLRINSSTEGDAGLYRCKISNGSNVISSVVNLKVGGKLPNLEYVSC